MIINDIKNIMKGLYKIVTLQRYPSQYFNYYKYLQHMKDPKEIVNYDPPHISFFPSYNCTLSCKMCLTHSPYIPNNPYKYKGAKMLDFDTFKRAIDKFNKAISCAFIGNGEPMLNKDLFSMIRYASKVRRMHTSLCTNGTLIDKHLNDIFLSGLDFLSVSINSHNRETYRYLTGHNEEIFDKILKNLKTLIHKRNELRSKLKIGITLIFDRKTVNMVQEMIDFGAGLGVDICGIYNIIPYPFTIERAKKMSIFVNDKELIEYLQKIKLPDNNHIKFVLPQLLSEESYKICRDFFASISIDGDGNISGCERLILNSEGNGKFFEEDVFNNRHFRELRRAFLSKDSAIPPPCHVCYNNSPYRVNI